MSPHRKILTAAAVLPIAGLVMFGTTSCHPNCPPGQVMVGHDPGTARCVGKVLDRLGGYSL